MIDFGIVLSCQGIGDILSSIPIIRYLNKYYNYKIPVFSYTPEIFKNFPYIDSYHFEEQIKYKDKIKIINTFDIHEYVHSRNDIKQLHANKFGIQLLPDELHLDYFPDKYEEIINLPENYIVTHSVKTWPSRTWNTERWQELINKLNNIDINIVDIGKDSSEMGTYNTKKPVFDIKIKKGLNLKNKLNISQTWHVLNKSNIIITMDSGILHLAGTTDSHILQLGSSINPKFRSPYRKGSQEYKYHYLLGDCNIFCASNSKYYLEHNKDHRKIPPIPFCLERPETIGDKDNMDINIYKCHPSVDKVIKKINHIYDYNNFKK